MVSGAHRWLLMVSGRATSTASLQRRRGVKDHGEVFPFFCPIPPALKFHPSLSLISPTRTSPTAPVQVFLQSCQHLTRVKRENIRQEVKKKDAIPEDNKKLNDIKMAEQAASANQARELFLTNRLSEAVG